MNIELWKTRKKELNLTFDELAELSGVSRRQLLYLFNGNAKNTGVETVHRIEHALGIDTLPAEQNLSVEEKELFDIITQLTAEELDELSNFIDYIISKRK